MKKHLITISAFAFATSAMCGSAQAAQIILTEASVIGDSGSYSYPSTTRPGNFPAQTIFDQQTGAIMTEIFGEGYWINGDNGPANAFITIDLGQTYSLGSFDLFNTSNGSNGDRGTGIFSITGSNTIIAAGGNGFMLGGAITTLASGTLTAALPSSARDAQSFSSLSNASFRYIQFNPTSVASAVPICCGIQNNYGLNELRVFAADFTSAVPEPATWAMMLLGFGFIGGAMRSAKRQQKATVSYA